MCFLKALNALELAEDNAINSKEEKRSTDCMTATVFFVNVWVQFI